MMLRRLLLVILTAAMLLALAPTARALDINIVPGSGLSANPQALDSFNRAAGQWEGRFSDPITVTINADLAALGSGILGSTDTVMLYGGYTTIRTAMVADAAPYPNNAIVSYLPTSGVSAYLPSGFSLGGYVEASKANLKALGFTGLDASFGLSDAAITFSTGYSYTYNHSSGVAPGTFDFETIAAHEIGHALGFISAVDEIDYYKHLGQTATIYPSTLDLFRFGANPSYNPSTTSQFTSFARMLVPGVEAVFDDLTSEYRMSTGYYTGDGRQASHWKDDDLIGSNIGIMDPTLGYGVYFDVAGSDARAMDLIGYDLVPLPATWWLLGSGLLGLAAFRLRQRW